MRHIVFTYDYIEQNVFVNGVRYATKRCPNGRFHNWDPAYHLILGNETSRNRPWRGKIFYAAIYNRPLTADEIRVSYQNYRGIARDKGCREKGSVTGSVVQYCFSEGEGDRIVDSSEANLHLNLTMPKWSRSIDKRAHIFSPYDYSIDKISEAIVNVIAFVPLGFLLHAFMRTRYKTSHLLSLFIIATGIIISSAFESLQYFSMTRRPSLFDIIHNSIGTGAGVVIDCWYTFQLRSFTKALHPESWIQSSDEQHEINQKL